MHTCTHFFLKFEFKAAVFTFLAIVYHKRRNDFKSNLKKRQLKSCATCAALCAVADVKRAASSCSPPSFKHFLVRRLSIEFKSPLNFIGTD